MFMKPKMKLLLTTLLSILVLSSCKNSKQVLTADKQGFSLGADISWITELESRGTTFATAEGEVMECTKLMKHLGLDAIRLRVWVNPRGGECDMHDVLAMALRAQAKGMAIMIDFHYSDWWADPGKQNIPARWRHYNYEAMKRALAMHTTETLKLLKDNGVDIKWIQIGNETTNGFLWPMGHTPENMKQYAGLTEAGYRAAKKVYPHAACIVHLDAACDIERYHTIFNGLKKYKAHFDMIGVSVYPYWDQREKAEKNDAGTLKHALKNMKRLVKKFGTPVMVVETGYEAARPEEGRRFMEKLISACQEMDGRCLGVFYWAPELEHHYPLGAFKDGRPTAIMEAFRHR
jgi:arabinogalactan endo-1,4-beta-galactosidase